MNKTHFTTKTINFLNHETRTDLTIILDSIDKSHNGTSRQHKFYEKAMYEDENYLLEAIETLLPLRSSSVTQAGIEEKKSTISLPLLLVDDEPIVLQVHKKMLIEKGYVVDVATNGQEALMLLSNKQYACIVTDIDMPIFSGIELAIRIRDNKNTKSIPIIAITANVSENIKRESLDVGINVVTKKPINSDDLDALIKIFF